MSANKKPRKAYRPRPIAVNTLELALHHAAVPAASDRAEILAVLRQSIQALREGVATERHWSIAAGAVSVARAIERQGIVRGLQGHIEASNAALQAIYTRAMRNGSGRWARVTLYFNEIEAVNDLLWMQKLQLDKLGRAEFLAAIDAAERDVIADGHMPITESQPERWAA